MKKTPLILGLVLLLSQASTALASPAVTLEAMAQMETATTSPDGTSVMKRIPATTVIPGSIVIYSHTITNNGISDAEDLVIDTPIPPEMTYLAGGAEDPHIRTTFSIDGGKSFYTPDRLTVREKDGTVRPAIPADYTHIRRVPKNVLSPGQSLRMEFRARLN